MTLNPVQAIMSSEDIRWGRAGGELANRGSRFCEGPGKSLHSGWSALTLLLGPHDPG